jgi:hypothetical protein
MTHMADRVEDKNEKIKQAASLLIECRDALPAITVVQQRLHNVSHNLDKRIEGWLEPWRVADDDPNGH